MQYPGRAQRIGYYGISFFSVSNSSFFPLHQRISDYLLQSLPYDRISQLVFCFFKKKTCTLLQRSLFPMIIVTQRLELLVDKVLKLSLFENKEIDLNYETCNLGDIVNDVIASLRLQAEKQQALIHLDIKGEPVLQADKLHMLSVVFNLLDNALKYSKENARIEVLLEEKDDTIQLIVSDNGIGIPQQYKDKVFEKFFRVPAGNTHNAKGHGLGLSYAANVIRQHGGSISLNSEEGRGSAFTIQLPKHRA